MLGELGVISGLAGASLAACLASPLKNEIMQPSHRTRNSALFALALVSSVIASRQITDWATGFGLWAAGIMLMPMIVVLLGPRFGANSLQVAALCAALFSAGVALHGVA